MDYLTSSVKVVNFFEGCASVTVRLYLLFFNFLHLYLRVLQVSVWLAGSVLRQVHPPPRLCARHL